MSTIEPPSRVARLVVVEEAHASAREELQSAVESVAATHVVFLRDGEPALLGETAEWPVAAEVDIDAVRARAEELTRTTVDLPDGTSREVLYARPGAVVIGDEGPALVLAPEPLTVDTDVHQLLASPSMLTVAADARLLGPVGKIETPTERKRCPGPEAHWAAVPPCNPICPVHKLRLD